MHLGGNVCIVDYIVVQCLPGGLSVKGEIIGYQDAGELLLGTGLFRYLHARECSIRFHEVCA